MLIKGYNISFYFAILYNLQLNFYMIYFNYRIGDNMVFKKPYAFFVKYFRVINLILTFILFVILTKLSSLHTVLNNIYTGEISNFSSLNDTYLGFKMYLLLILSSVILILMVILLKRKDKPFRDYALAIIYNVILIVFFVSISNLFFSLENVTIEQATLKLYSDISLLIMLPMLYFIFRFILIVIGFNLKKFNFSKDIIELKQEEGDNEEVELVISKDTYKYKRSIRRYIREFKYYILENKFIILIIVSILMIVGVGTLASINIFNKNKVNLNENFVAGNFSYVVKSLYETEYDLNHNLIKSDSKFVIAVVNVINNYNESSSIDLNRIRLLYGDEYVYASDYYNKYFLDLGIPYNKNILSSEEKAEYLFIFKVPNTYKSKSYTLKFYNKNVYEEELMADYKVIETTAKRLDNKFVMNDLVLQEKTYFDKNSYGDSYLKINSYLKTTTYKYQENELTNIILPNDYNDTLLVIEYELNLDKNSSLSSYFNKDKDFFANFLKIEYKYNDKIKTISDIDIVSIGIDNRVFISVPNNIFNSEYIKLNINFRNFGYVYNLEY